MDATLVADTSSSFEPLRKKFASLMPDFDGFGSTTDSYASQERNYKDALVAAYRRLVRPLLDRHADAELSSAIYALLVKEKLPPDNEVQNLLGWRITTHLSKLEGENILLAGSLFRDLLIGPDDAVTRLDRFYPAYFSILRPMLRAGGQSEIRQIATLLLMLDDPVHNILARQEIINGASELFYGSKLINPGTMPNGDEYRRVLELATAVRDQLAAWGWPPRDLLDVQGFLWVACGTAAAESGEGRSLQSGALFTPPGATDDLVAALLAAAHPRSRSLVVRVRPSGDWAHLAEDTSSLSLAINPGVTDLELLGALTTGDAILMINEDGEAIAVGIITSEYIRADNSVGVRWRTEGFPRRVSPDARWRYHAISEVKRELIPHLLLEEPTRLPVEEPDFSTICARIWSAGMLIGGRLLRRYHSALLTRGFVVLAGLSGAGKTWLTQAYADAIGARYLLCPVAPNWTSNEDLLGYLNPLTGIFHPTAFTRFLGEACDEWEAATTRGTKARQYHLVLDEMNLARVEYYFARFLSAMEMRARSADRVADLELYPGHGGRLTPNLIFIGTVNIDETTHGFSDKVFDRAQLVELGAPRELLQAQLGGAVYADTLLAVWDAVEHVAPFAYRVVDDIAAYIRHAEAAGASWQEALDEQVLQKILPKLRGNDPRVGVALLRLQDATSEMPLARERAGEMAERFTAHGFVSFF